MLIEKKREFDALIRYLILLAITVSTNNVLAYDYFNGQQLYNKFCVECHGVTGQGELANTPDFSQGERLHKSDEALVAHIRDGSGFAPAFGLSLTEQEMRDILVYLRSLY